jgi:catechol 2,3-dioxygenase-like lactoylglutathione lyase family enzyme
MGMSSSLGAPLFRKIDCVCLPVPDLDTGLTFYRDRLGHELIWRTPTQLGLRMPDTGAEIVLQIERPSPEVDLLVTSVEEAVGRIVAAGGQIVTPPFEIQIGKAAVVQDPWGNLLTILDASKGSLITDADGNVIGNMSPATDDRTARGSS